MEAPTASTTSIRRSKRLKITEEESNSTTTTKATITEVSLTKATAIDWAQQLENAVEKDGPDKVREVWDNFCFAMDSIVDFGKVLLEIAHKNKKLAALLIQHIHRLDQPVSRTSVDPFFESLLVLPAIDKLSEVVAHPLVAGALKKFNGNNRRQAIVELHRDVIFPQITKGMRSHDVRELLKYKFPITINDINAPFDSDSCYLLLFGYDRHACKLPEGSALPPGQHVSVLAACNALLRDKRRKFQEGLHLINSDELKLIMEKKTRSTIPPPLPASEDDKTEHDGCDQPEKAYPRSKKRPIEASNDPAFIDPAASVACAVRHEHKKARKAFNSYLFSQENDRAPTETTNTGPQAKPCMIPEEEDDMSGPNQFVDLLRNNNDPDATPVCELEPTLLLVAVSLAYPKVTRWLNSLDTPLDMFLESGREARKAFGLDPDKTTDKKSRFRVEAHPLLAPETRRKMEKDPDKKYLIVAPIILRMVYPTTDELRNSLIEHKLKLPHNLENSKMGDSCSRVTIARPELVEPTTEVPPIDGNGPAIKVGKTAVVAVPGSYRENKMKAFYTEVYGLLVQAVNDEIDNLILGGKGEGWVPPKASPQKARANKSRKRKRGGPTKASPQKARANAKPDLLSPVEELIQDVRPPKEDRIIPEEYYHIPLWLCNLIIGKVGFDANYFWHQDGSWILNSDDRDNPKNRLGNGDRLPLCEEMGVLTHCYSPDHYSAITRLKARNSKEEPCAALDLGRSAMHAQSPCCNANGFQHCSYRLKGAMELPDGTCLYKGDKRFTKQQKHLIEQRESKHDPVRDGTRAIDTSRQCADYKYDKAAYNWGIAMDGLATKTLRQGKKKIYYAYDRHNANHGFRKLPGATGADPWFMKDPSIGDWKDARKERQLDERVARPVVQKGFHRMSKQNQLEFHKEFIQTKKLFDLRDYNKGMKEVTVKGIKMPLRTLGTDRKSAGVLSYHHTTTEWAIRKNIRLNVVVGKEESPADYQPLLVGRGNLPNPSGLPVTKEEVPLPGTTYAHLLIDHKCPNCLQLTTIYKQHPKILALHLEVAQDFFTWQFGDDPTLYSEPGLLPEYKPDSDKMAEMKLRYEGLFRVPLEIHGPGGSAQPSGSHPFSDGTSKPEDPHDMTGTPQMHSQNEIQALDGACKSEAVIQIFLDNEKLKLPLEDYSRRKRAEEAEEAEEPSSTDEENEDKEMDTSSVSQEEEEDEMDAASEAGSDTEEETDGEEASVVSHADHADQGLEKWQSGKENGFTALGLYTPKRFRFERLKMEEVRERFDKFPGYFESNLHNLSYLVNGFYVYEMEPLSWEVQLKICKDYREGNGHKYQQMNVPQVSRPLVTNENSIRKSLGKTLLSNGEDSDQSSLSDSDDDSPMYPAGLITREHVLEYMTTKQEEELEFIKALQNEQTDIQLRRRGLYAVEMSELLAMKTALMAAGASRMDITKCTRKCPQEPTKIEVTPLGSEETDRIPDVHRMKATACANRDYDMSVVFFRDSALRLIDHKKDQLVLKDLVVRKHGRRGEVRYAGSYDGLDLTHSANVELLVELLFTAVLCRLTGSVPRLSTFPAWLKERYPETYKTSEPPSLPTMETGKDWILFIRAMRTKNGVLAVISKQHEGRVPKIFRSKETGLDRLDEFVEKFSNKQREGGLLKVRKYLSRDKSRITRVGLKLSLDSAIANCAGAGVQASSKQTGFVAHQSIADVESIFHEFAGEVTFESLEFGPGGMNGLRILAFRSKFRLNSDKFKELFQDLVKAMKKLDELHLQAMGWWKDASGELRSCLGGRKFSLTDLEHTCCKVYVCVCLSYSSRTGSHRPELFVSHCWPTRGSGEWTDTVTQSFAEIWKAFLQLPKDYLKKNYPQQIRYHCSDYYNKKPEKEKKNNKKD